jgi:hypothetical protein
MFDSESGDTFSHDEDVITQERLTSEEKAQKLGM